MFCAEHVGVAVNQFFGNGLGDFSERKAIFFFGQLRVKNDLEQEVTEFLTKLGVHSALDGFDDFVGLLDERGAQREVGLFAVPRTPVGRAQSGHDGAEFEECGFWGGCGHGERDRCWRLGYRWASQTLMSSKSPSLPAQPSSILDLVAWAIPEDLR